MDRNLLLAFALSFLVLTTWTMWQEAQLEEGAEGRSPSGRARSESESPVSELGRIGEIALDEFPALPEGEDAPPAFDPEDAAVPEESGQTIEVEQPLYQLTLNTIGARIESWELREYFDKAGARVVLLDRGVGSGAVTPFADLELGNLAVANWRIREQGASSVVFELERQGVALRKTYRFESDSYVVRVLLEVENRSQVELSPRFALRWPAKERSGNDFREQSIAVLQNGVVELELLAGYGTDGFFSSAVRETRFEGEIDWAGSQTPYFLTAVFPDSPAAASARFVATEPGVSAVVECFFKTLKLRPGQSASREYRIYAGPKESERLEALGSDAIKSVDLGWSWIAPLTRLFGWLLEVMYSFVGNYGVAIVLLTVLVRLVTTPLTMKQMKSMERMRILQPKVKELQEKYSDDRQKQSEEMMRLYKQEKVNPLGGCLPLILQMPVFIGLFYALQSSVHLRQAEFFGWIDDLSAPETLFVIPGTGLPVRVLPIVMALSMVVQQKITPMQADPAQAKMMMTIMPVMMLVLFYQFPSGLVLYWMISNVLGIVHQLYIGRGMRKS